MAFKMGGYSAFTKTEDPGGGSTDRQRKKLESAVALVKRTGVSGYGGRQDIYDKELRIAEKALERYINSQ